MKHTVKLKFFEDEANGEWGIAPGASINHPTPFNAFWGGIAIFHDVFEHWHEYNHKYFIARNAMNVGGEMAAMGAMMYFVEEMGMENSRRINPSGRWLHEEMAISTTLNEIEDSIKHGYTRYGDTLESGVPRQLPVASGFEVAIDGMWQKIKEMTYTGNDGDDYEEDKKRAWCYKKSVTLAKIRNLHRWGYKEAARRFPRNNHNMTVLYEFIKFWEGFTKRNDAQEMASAFTGITFRTYKVKNLIHWTATLEAMHGGDYKDYKISSRNLSLSSIPSLDDMISYNFEEY